MLKREKVTLREPLINSNVNHNVKREKRKREREKQIPCHRDSCGMGWSGREIGDTGHRKGTLVKMVYVV